MPFRRSLPNTKPKLRHPHWVTIDDKLWEQLADYCYEHNLNPGEVIENALTKVHGWKKEPII